MQDKTAEIPRRGGFSIDDRTSEGNSIINERTEQQQGRVVSGRRPRSLRLRFLQHHRRLSGRLQETSQPGGHGHGDHFYCSGSNSLSHYTASLA